MNKGSIASSALVVALTGGYLAYEQFGNKKTPSSKPAPSPTPGSSSTVEAPTKPRDTTATDGEPSTAPARPTVRELEMPNLSGLTPEEAAAKLIGLGFSPGVLEIRSNTACSYSDDTEMVKQGTICNQARSPGGRQMSNAKVRVAVEYDSYESGGIETGDAWRRMPKIEGLSIEAAQALLREQGFSDDDFSVEERATCGKRKVCDQSPRPGNRKYASSPGRITLGT